MEILLFFTVVVLVGGLVGGGFLIRDFGQQVLTRDTRATVEAIQARTEAETDRIRQELRGLVAEYQNQLGRLRARDVELLALVEGERERTEGDDAVRQDAATALAEVERLRAEVQCLGQGGASDASRQVARETALVEIDRQAAQIETSIVALTNPILLPGEPFAVPDDFAPDALRWDNWKDVGESAFALGELFTLRRIHLSPHTAASVTRCVSLLRTTLTGAIYPNLDPLPSVAQRQMLFEGLTTVGDALASMRQELAAEYHGRNVSPPPATPPAEDRARPMTLPIPEPGPEPAPARAPAVEARDGSSLPAANTATPTPAPTPQRAAVTDAAPARPAGPAPSPTISPTATIAARSAPTPAPARRVSPAPDPPSPG
ncbi:MAG: hypothetical protein WKF80_02300 [Thermomicrobiales bacterium]